MLFVNNVLVSPSGNTPVEKEIKAQMKEVDALLEQGGGIVKFRYPPQKERKDPTVVVLKGPDRQRKTPTGIPLSCVVFHEERGAETWSYKKSATSKEGTLRFKGELYCEKKDKDLIFYLMFKSRSYNNKIEVEDRAKDARFKAEKSRKDILIGQHIYGDSPVNNDEDLRSIAKALYVPEVDSIKDLDVVRVEVEKAAIENKEYFLELIENKKEIQLKSAIQQAIDERLIMFDDKKYQWIYPDKGYVILELRPHQIKEKLSYLENYLKNNEKEFAYIENSGKKEKKVGKKSKKELYEELGISIKDSGQIKRPALIAKAKELGLDISGSVADLEKRILKSQ